MTSPHEEHAFPFVELDAEGKPVAIETGMTLRQYAAIKLRVPNSGTDWLDEMIRQSLRDELAAKAMQTLIACAWDRSGDTNHIIDDDGRVSLHLRSYEQADAMLKARETA